MRAVVIDRPEGGAQTVELREFDEAQFMPGDVLVRVTHSAVNYKDGLAVTGKAPVVRRFPMIPGIDLAGVVEASDHPGSARATRCCSTAGAPAKRTSAPGRRSPA
jgi:acrylyl-CoA reductase (NADPH)